MATGIFGGTFDPIHIGHLRTALELKVHLGLDEMLLLPCGDPPHRQRPMTPGAQRRKMAELAVADEGDLRVDGREIRRKGASYSYDTLLELRAEYGEDEPLCLCIGMDSLVHINQWFRWRELLDLAHIVVAARPGWSIPTEGEVASMLASHQIEDTRGLLKKPYGSLYIAEMTLLPVSASDIRQLLHRGQSIRYLTPDSVISFIKEHTLYV